MGYYTDISAGVGAFLSSGFLSMLGALEVAQHVAVTDPFANLELSLFALGVVFVAAGVIERFFTAPIKPKADAEAAGSGKTPP